MTFHPRIFTFYSYKGGVGRSMALLNMAYYLQARGRHVLIVDLDLEAPGASGFLHRSDELLPRESTGDVVDVLQKVVNVVKQTSAGEVPPLPALDLKDYLRSVRPDKYATAVHPKVPRARMDVLGAEQGPDYTARYSTLELSSLSADQVADTSDLLRSLLIQHSFPFHQPWQEESAEPESTYYDYILVDSRTGLSEIGGLCVGPLSDRLIVLCGLNDQNIEGTRHFLDVVGLEAKARAATANAWDDADPPAEGGLRPATLGPKPTLLVASPVPGGEMTYKKKRLAVLEERLGMAPAKLSYHPQMALMETIFVRDYADEYLALEYATLAERVMSMVGDTVPQLMGPVPGMLTTSSIIETAKTISGAANQIVEPMLLAQRTSKREMAKLETVDLVKRLARSALAGPQGEAALTSFRGKDLGLSDDARAQIWRLQINLAATDEMAALRWLEWADDDQDIEQTRNTGSHEVLLAIQAKYRKAVALNPRLHQAFQNWGAALSQWANTKTGVEADALFSQACEKYKQAAVIQPHNYEMLYNWSTALSHWAGSKTGAEADALYVQAVEKYEKAAAIQPNDHAVFHNWGAALSQWAKIKEGTESDTLRAEACEKYRRAATIQPHDYATFHNWGTALLQWAKTTAGVSADSLLAQACEKFEQAVAIQPENHLALRNWAATLMHWARNKKGAEADAFFILAIEKCQQTAIIEPGDYANFYNWGNALSDWAKTKAGEQADDLYNQACERYQQAATIQPNDNSILSNWGTALLNLAKTKTGTEADALYSQACEKYQQAAVNQPDDYETNCNWGCALSDWAKIKSPTRAADLLTKACEKYQQASYIKPGDHPTLYGWGNALAHLATIKAGAEADALFALACEKFQQAVPIRPNDHATFNNWGAALANWAATKKGAEAETLSAQAEEKYQEVLSIQPDNSIALYNLGCLAAQQGKVEEAVAALEKWKSSAPEANKAKLDGETDFGPIRSDPRFQALRDGLAG